MEVLESVFSKIIDNNAKLNGFSSDVKIFSSRLTEAILMFFKFVSEKLPLPPSKFHYIINLRDLSLVYKGVCFVTP